MTYVYLVIKQDYDPAPPVAAYRRKADALTRCRAEAELAAKEARAAARRHFKYQLDWYAEQIAQWGERHVPPKELTTSTSGFGDKPDPWDAMTLGQRLATTKTRGVRKVRLTKDDDGWGTNSGDYWYVHRMVLLGEGQ